MCSHIQGNTVAIKIEPECWNEWQVCFLGCTVTEDGCNVNLPEKSGGDGFKGERGYLNNREKLLKEKDLRIFVAIMEKSYVFFKF